MFIKRERVDLKALLGKSNVAASVHLVLIESGVFGVILSELLVTYIVLRE
jgi:hypothetical protein